MNNKDIKIVDKEIAERDCKKVVPLKEYSAMSRGGKIEAGKLKFKVNEIVGKGWRLVHKDGKVLSIFEAGEGSRTGTIWGLIVGNSKEEVRKLGEKAGLDFTDIDKEEEII